jgi:hypothetical protein
MRRVLVTTVCIGLTSGGLVFPQESQETEKKVSEKSAPPAVEQAPDNDLISSKEILNSIEASGFDFDKTVYSDDAFSKITIDTNNAVERVYTNDLTRLELKRMQISGTTTPVIKQRTFGSFLQLFNPFAPAAYGGTDEPIGKAPSRAFADPILTQPSTPLVGIGNSPSKPDAK